MSDTVSSAASARPAAAAGQAAGAVFLTELNPVHLLRRAAYMYPDKVAIAHGERRLSYRQFADRSWQLANALRAAGLRKGDRVAALLANSPAMLEAHFGVPAAGGILRRISNALDEVIVDGLSEASVYPWTLRMSHCNGWCSPWAVTAVAARHA